MFYCVSLSWPCLRTQCAFSKYLWPEAALAWGLEICMWTHVKRTSRPPLSWSYVIHKMAEQVRSQILNKPRSFFCCLPFLRNTLCSLLLKYSHPALAAAILSLQNHHPVFEVTITKAPRQTQLRSFILTEAARIPFCKADSTEGCIAVQWEAAVCI